MPDRTNISLREHMIPAYSKPEGSIGPMPKPNGTSYGNSFVPVIGMAIYRISPATGARTKYVPLQLAERQTMPSRQSFILGSSGVLYDVERWAPLAGVDFILAREIAG